MMIYSGLVISIATLFGPTLAVICGIVLNQRYARIARSNATTAQIAVANAAENASNAAAAAATAARVLIETARITDNNIVRISDVTAATHRIVNGERSALLSKIAQLCRRIADENPGDIEAEVIAGQAELVACAPQKP
jgi:hypothetical protein